MNKFESFFGRMMKKSGILSLKEAQSLIDDAFGYLKGLIPEDQLYRIPNKFEWDADKSIEDNLFDVITYNVYEYVAKKNNLLKKGYKFDFVTTEGVGILDSPEDCTDTVEVTVRFGEHNFKFMYSVSNVNND